MLVLGLVVILLLIVLAFVWYQWWRREEATTHHHEDRVTVIRASEGIGPARTNKNIRRDRDSPAHQRKTGQTHTLNSFANFQLKAGDQARLDDLIRMRDECEEGENPGVLNSTATVKTTKFSHTKSAKERKGQSRDDFELLSELDDGLPINAFPNIGVDRDIHASERMFEKMFDMPPNSTQSSPGNSPPRPKRASVTQSLSPLSKPSSSTAKRGDFGFVSNELFHDERRKSTASPLLASWIEPNGVVDLPSTRATPNKSHPRPPSRQGPTSSISPGYVSPVYISSTDSEGGSRTPTPTKWL